MKKQNIIKKIVCFLIIIGTLFADFPLMEVKGATAKSYDDAEVFFHSTGKGTGKHIDIVAGVVYFATQGKLAHTRSERYVAGHIYYRTQGFDVTLTGNGKSVTFAVKIGDSLSEVLGSARTDKNGMHYELFQITTDKLRELAMKADPINAPTVLSTKRINVRLDAIIAKRLNDVTGSIEEDDNGDVAIAPSRDWIFRLGNEADLKRARALYGVKFAEHTEITAWLDNYTLTTMYHIGEGAEVRANSYDKGLYKDSSITISDMLYQSGSLWQKKYTLLQKFTFFNVDETGLNLYKKGYHLVEGKEWIKSGDVSYSAGKGYEVKEIVPEVGYSDKKIIFRANWKPNKYTVVYNANGGAGTTASSVYTYDEAKEITPNGFSRTGYTFMGWATSKDGEVVYADKESVLNLTATNGGTVNLYAVWEANVYNIPLDNQGATTAGTTDLYVKYNTGYYSNSACSIAISSIICPTRTGYTFGGYYTGIGGTGTQCINKDGVITSTNTDFLRNTILYAKWDANTYTISYHANGGSGDMADTIATYDASAWLRSNAFTRTGYTFKGWAISEDGEVAYADKESVLNLTATNGGTVNLYAVWEPVTPFISLNPQEGSGGTSSFYEKYGINFFSDNLFTDVISSIIKPERVGYDFGGYFADKIGGNNPLIDAIGNFLVDSTHFLTDTTLFAKWFAKTYTITFDMQGGSFGSDSVLATYDSLIPSATAPVREGFTFKGYYTEANGGGTQFYDEFMNPLIVYDKTEDTTLFAKWEDSFSPFVELNGGGDTWTKNKVTLTANARDFGVGLSSVYIFRIESDGTLTEVASEVELNGVKTKEVTFVNEKEGALRFKAVATDLNGNTSESYNTVYYDRTAPSGEIVDMQVNGNTFYFSINITDINTGN